MVPRELRREGVELLVDEGVVVEAQKKEEEKKKDETAAEVEEAPAAPTSNGVVVKEPPPAADPTEPAAPSAFDADVAILRGWRESEPVLQLLWPADDDVTKWAGVLWGEAAAAAMEAGKRQHQERQPTAQKTEQRVLSLRLSGVGLAGGVPEVRWCQAEPRL